MLWSVLLNFAGNVRFISVSVNAQKRMGYRLSAVEWLALSAWSNLATWAFLMTSMEYRQNNYIQCCKVIEESNRANAKDQTWNLPVHNVFLFVCLFSEVFPSTLVTWRNRIRACALNYIQCHISLWKIGFQEYAFSRMDFQSCYLNSDWWEWVAARDGDRDFSWCN